MPRANLISLFTDFARYARDVAVVQRHGYRRECWTYAQLASVAVWCAGLLREKGIRTGERVILWGPNSAEGRGGVWGWLVRRGGRRSGDVCSGERARCRWMTGPPRNSRRVLRGKHRPG